MATARTAADMLPLGVEAAGTVGSGAEQRQHEQQDVDRGAGLRVLPRHEEEDLRRGSGHGGGDPPARRIESHQRRGERYKQPSGEPAPAGGGSDRLPQLRDRRSMPGALQRRAGAAPRAPPGLQQARRASTRSWLPPGTGRCWPPSRHCGHGRDHDLPPARAGASATALRTTGRCAELFAVRLVTARLTAARSRTRPRMLCSTSSPRRIMNIPATPTMPADAPVRPTGAMLPGLKGSRTGPCRRGVRRARS